MKLIYLDAADSEFDEAIAYYNKERDGETCRGPPFKTLAAIGRFTVGVMVTGATLGPVTDAVCLKAGIWIMPRW